MTHDDGDPVRHRGESTQSGVPKHVLGRLLRVLGIKQHQVVAPGGEIGDDDENVHSAIFQPETLH